MATMHEILTRYGVSLEMSANDASQATNRALPRDEARALRAELEAAGIEASDAPDSDDRALSWVYVTVEV